VKQGYFGSIFKRKRKRNSSSTPRHAQGLPGRGATRHGRVGRAVGPRGGAREGLLGATAGDWGGKHAGGRTGRRRGAARDAPRGRARARQGAAGSAAGGPREGARQGPRGGAAGEPLGGRGARRRRGTRGGRLGRAQGGRAGEEEGEGEGKLTSGSKSGDHRLQNLGHHEWREREGGCCAGELNEGKRDKGRGGGHGEGTAPGARGPRPGRVGRAGPHRGSKPTDRNSIREAKSETKLSNTRD
jgi:hypothetical protein